MPRFREQEIYYENRDFSQVLDNLYLALCCFIRSSVESDLISAKKKLGLAQSESSNTCMSLCVDFSLCFRGCTESHLDTFHFLRDPFLNVFFCSRAWQAYIPKPYLVIFYEQIKHTFVEKPNLCARKEERKISLWEVFRGQE